MATLRLTGLRLRSADTPASAAPVGRPGKAKDSSGGAARLAGYPDSKVVVAPMRHWPAWKGFRRMGRGAGTPLTLDELLASFRARTVDGRVELSCEHSLVWPDWAPSGDFPTIGRATTCPCCGTLQQIASGAPKLSERTPPFHGWRAWWRLLQRRAPSEPFTSPDSRTLLTCNEPVLAPAGPQGAPDAGCSPTRQ